MVKAEISIFVNMNFGAWLDVRLQDANRRHAILFVTDADAVSRRKISWLNAANALKHSSVQGALECSKMPFDKQFLHDEMAVF